MSSFTTEFGHTIPFVPGYFERNKNYAVYANKQEIHKDLQVHQGEELNTAAPLKDWVEFSSAVYFMAKNGLGRTYKRGIDLGGAEGTCMRMFKAAGIVDHATSVDIDDYSKIADDDYFEQIIEITKNIESANLEAQQSVQGAKKLFDYFAHVKLADGMVTDFPHKPVLDENLHMDLMNTPGQYDLVTSFFCFDYLEINKALAKVRSLLAPGGVFVGQLEYWWWPINSTAIIGHFPYAGQRLTFEDLTRYYKENHPQLMDNLNYKYSYFHEGQQHPTIGDWFAAARENGLKPLAVERIVPKSHPSRLTDCPHQIFGASWFDHREVLRDIHQFKPDVTVDDLFTSAIRLALVAI